MALLSLPDELLIAIGTFLRPQDLFRLIRVNRQFHSIFEPILYLQDARESHPNIPAALTWAACNGDAKIARKALAQVKVDKLSDLNGGGELLTTLVIPRGHYEVAKVLLASGRVDVNEEDKYGTRPLIAACRQGMDKDLRIVELLLSVDGIDVSAINSDGTPALELAVDAGNLELVKLLVSFEGIELTSKAYPGRTPLWPAAAMGHSHVFKFLLGTGKIDPAARNEGQGMTLLHWLADAETDTVEEKEMVQLLLAADGVDVSARDDRGCTALFYAARECNVGIMEVLLDAEGADPDFRNRNGDTALMCAAWGAGSVNDHRWLVERGADPDSSGSGSGGGSSPVPENASTHPLKGAAGVVKLLLERGSDPNSRNDDGWTPLMFAADVRSVEVIRLLLERGADPNHRNHDGLTPLMFAADVVGSVDAIKLLLARGADPNSRNDDGWTPPMFAANLGSVDAIKLLLERGADPEHSATYLALVGGHSEAKAVLFGAS